MILYGTVFSRPAVDKGVYTGIRHSLGMVFNCGRVILPCPCQLVLKGAG